jgi:hypothetical protein
VFPTHKLWRTYSNHNSPHLSPEYCNSLSSALPVSTLTSTTHLPRINLRSFRKCLKSIQWLPTLSLTQRPCRSDFYFPFKSHLLLALSPQLLSHSFSPVTSMILSHLRYALPGALFLLVIRCLATSHLLDLSILGLKCVSIFKKSPTLFSFTQ